MRDVPWRSIFFAINFSVAILFAIACAVSVGESLVGGGSPFAFLGGVCFVLPVSAFGITEWLLFVRNARAWERPLGVVCGLVGVLAIFGFASNVDEAIQGGNSPGLIFWLGFGTVSLMTAIYGFWCCWWRLRHGGDSTGRGFPLDDSEKPTATPSASDT